MTNYKISPNAEADLKRIWFYGLEHWGVEAADRYHSAFFDHFEELAAQPLLYAISDIREGYDTAYAARTAFFIVLTVKPSKS